MKATICYTRKDFHHKRGEGAKKKKLGDGTLVCSAGLVKIDSFRKNT